MISQFILLLTLVFVSLGTSLSMTSFHEIQSSIASPGVVSTFNADQLFLDFVAVGETTARNVMSEFLTEEVVGSIPADYFRRIGGRGRLLASVLQELYDKSASSAQDAKRIFEEVMTGQTTTTGNPHSLYGCWLRGAGNNPIWSFYVLILRPVNMFKFTSRSRVKSRKTISTISCPISCWMILQGFNWLPCKFYFFPLFFFLYASDM